MRTTSSEPTGSAADFLPDRITLASMRKAVEGCRGCALFRCGHSVFGEGPAPAMLMFVGEQPGDQEEQMRRPFVGPSGRLFDEAMLAAGLDRAEAYVTNAVKHFKHIERGKRRIHQTPKDPEIRACYPWLDEEIAVVQPRIIVVLGATAAQALLGKQFRVTQQRGIPLETPLADCIVATVHPSSVLRAFPDERVEARRAFFADIEKVAQLMHTL